MRHYIRKAGAQDYWFDFSANKLEAYRTKFGDKFCLVVYGSEVVDDAYVIPYSDVITFFSEDLLDDRHRWIGNIRHNIIRVSPGGKSMSLSAYYNAFELLEETEQGEHKSINESKALYNTDGLSEEENLKKRIRAFNDQYRDAKPYKRRVVSEQVARPGAITDYLKELLGYTCQLCGERGFLQANGVPYVEAHHITELHKLIAGSYCSDNIIIVCATCHRKLHFASVTYEATDPLHVTVKINGMNFTFARTLLSPSAR